LVERAFKGIWIPKEIWLDKELTVLEKIFLVEIDSLDNKDGCWASNKYFSEFFGVTKGRCTQIIKSLETKKFITITLEREGKVITKRVIKVVNKLNTPSKKIKQGYLENDEENNTSINNTKDNTSSPNESVDSDFDKLWALYPRKEGKKAALKKYKEVIKKGTATNKQIQDGIVAYKRHLKAEGIEQRFIKQGGTYFNGECWNDQYEVEKPNNPLEQKFEYF
jgi:hypothetical protein